MMVFAILYDEKKKVGLIQKCWVRKGGVEKNTS